MSGFHLEFGAGLTSAASDDAIRQTFLGQAHIAGTGPAGKTCRECVFWHQWRATSSDSSQRKACLPGRYGSKAAASLQGTLKRARCNRPIANKANRLIPPHAMACRLFEENAAAPVERLAPTEAGHVVNVHGKPLTLTEETIAATWATLARECREHAKAARDGEFRMNNPLRYAEEQEALARRYDAHEGRMSLTFIQRAVEIQAGECVPLLSDGKRGKG